MTKDNWVNPVLHLMDKLEDVCRTNYVKESVVFNDGKESIEVDCIRNPAALPEKFIVTYCRNGEAIESITISAHDSHSKQVEQIGYVLTVSGLVD